MKRRSLLKVFPLTFLPATLLQGCNPLEQQGKRAADRYIEIGESPFKKTNAFSLLSGSQIPNDTVNLVVMGDSGVDNDEQKQVSDIIANYHQQYPVDAIIHSGDLIYPNGLSSPDDPLGYSHFEDYYLRPELMKADSQPVPIYAVLGNHDHYGDADAMIEFSKQHSQILQLPSRYYKVNTKHAGISGVETEIFFLDSYPMTKNRTRYEQIAWLDQQLNASTAERKIIVTHHPLRVYGYYHDNAYLKDTIEVLAEQYGVCVCLAGHDHQLQIQTGSNGITYLVSGAGGAALRSSGVGSDSIFSAAQHGAIAIQISSSHIRYIPLIEFNSGYPDYEYYLQ